MRINKSRRFWCAVAITSPFLLHGADLQEPLTLSSDNGVLNVLMVAKAAPITTLTGNPTGWVYEICKRPSGNVTSCPTPQGVTPNYYGGTLLRLRRGDHLKIHFVNKLPAVMDSDHAMEPGREFLSLNPTNLHTHGLLVSPRVPSLLNPTYGDNVFVLTFNSANGKPMDSPHMHSTVRYDFTDYDIKIPETHPSGLFWFHPHAHGLALNQVSAGLAGLITVGEWNDYVSRDENSYGGVSGVATRHLLLKDTQILPEGKLQDQEDPDFCPPAPPDSIDPRRGSCEGQDTTEAGGPDYSDGKWFFTVNGLQYPTVPVKTAGGEIWRIANTSGSVTYDLRLWNPAQKRDMLVQVLSIDGVSVSPTAGVDKDQLAQMNGGKFVPEACPGIEHRGREFGHNEPLCTRRLVLMPSARAEIWVTYRTTSDGITAPPKGSYAVLRTNGFETGPAADKWPAADLARVEFQNQSPPVHPKALRVRGEAISMLAPWLLANSMRAENAAVSREPSCKPLPPGHMRRIFYAAPTQDQDAFGLGYEEIDSAGNVIGPKASDVHVFDPMTPAVCVPLGPGNTPTTERWQLVNVATEDHNFHMHQIRFRVLSKAELDGTVTPRGFAMDNVPLPHATGTCGNNLPDDDSNPIADWRAGICNAKVVTVEIPFSIAGDFVYHCHILEHEDGGMMARIRVQPTP